MKSNQMKFLNKVILLRSHGYTIYVVASLDLLGSTLDRDIHLSLESDRLVLELLGRLATLDTLGVELADAALGETDELDHLLLHALRDGAAGALDHGVLGDADLVLLVDVGVLLGGVAVFLSRGVDGGHVGLLGLVLGAPLPSSKIWWVKQEATETEIL